MINFQNAIEKLNELLFSSKDKIYAILRITDSITLYIALGTLIYTIGFNLESDEVSQVFGWLEVLIFIFVIDYFIRMIYSFQRVKYIFERKIESFLVLSVMLIFTGRLVGIDLPYNLFLLLDLKDYRAFYEFFIATYLLILTIIGVARGSQVISTVKIKPATTFIISFILLILTGTFMLMMPAMTTRPDNISFLDALFISTSASCVTGLSVVTVASFFTFKGQFLILILIQLGGIGIVSFATFFATFLSKGVGMKQQAIIQDVLSSESLSSAKNMLKQIVLLTFFIEVVGAVALYVSWGPEVNFYSPVSLEEIYYDEQVQVLSYEESLQNSQKEEQNRETFEVAPPIGEEVEGVEVAPPLEEEEIAGVEVAPPLEELDDTTRVAVAGGINEVITVVLPKGVIKNEVGRPFGTVVSYAQINNSWFNRLYYSIFHSVSAFCNAGFSLFPDGLGQEHVSTSYAMHLVIILLITFGSLGFSAIQDIFSPQKLQARLRTPWKQWSLGTQIAVNMTVMLTVLGAIAYFFLEQHKTLEGKNIQEQIITALFQSVTTRTAGFNTVPMGISSFEIATYIMLIFLMFIGAASGSTGGGIKTSTFLLLVSSAFSSIQGKKTVEIAKRSIPAETINRAFSIVAFAIAYNVTCIFIFSIIQPTDIRLLFFEQVSAFATVGLSLGITPSLNEYSQALIILTMYIGRVGTLTLALALSKTVLSTSYKYPTAHVMVG